MLTNLWILVICLWRARLNKLNCFNRLHRWGSSVLDRYVLCDCEDETTAHIFFNCRYSRQVYMELLHDQHTLCAIPRMVVPFLSMGGLRLGNIIDGINSFTKGSPCWGFHWITLDDFMWQIWNKRNKRYMEKVSRPAETVVTQFITDLDTIFGRQSSKIPTNWDRRGSRCKDEQRRLQRLWPKWQR